jgi:TRAP-type C4-dicarboxylate transport system permease small subunit
MPLVDQRKARALRAFDAKFAQLEGYLATALLLSMILVASLSALLFNVAERGVAWAATALTAMSWADTFLQKGTLWIAFLGASLATHEDKHIAIDALVRTMSGRAASILRAIAALSSGLVACALALVFYRASVASDATVPFEYELLTAHGPAHICDVALAELGTSSRPGLLCLARSALASVGIPISTLAGLSQLISPVMLLVIGLRLLARGIGLATGVTAAPSPAVVAPDETR